MKRVDDEAGAVGHEYKEGSYFANPFRHAEDGAFKTDCFLRAFVPLARRNRWRTDSYVDVGCGSGEVVRRVSRGLRAAGFGVDKVKGYDVSPHVHELAGEGIEYVFGDFAQSEDSADLVTLFDVVEHVPDPIGFLREVAQRTDVLVLHIPLDNTFNNALRNRFRRLLRDPGHLFFMDTVSALNLVALAGARVVEYDYTFAFLSPSGHRSVLSRIVLPGRWLFAKLSPWLLSRTLGGVSLLVIAVTRRGLKNGVGA